MASLAYNKGKEKLLKGLLGDLSSGGVTIKAMLVTNTYTALSDSTKQGHEFISQVTAISGAEVTGTGYTAGGMPVTSKAVTIDTGTGKVKLTCDDVTWVSATLTAYGMIFYVDTGTPSTSPLLRFEDFGSAKPSGGGDFIADVPTDGILYLL